MNKQRGGTILGFILGVVVGLGIALGVAVYVTKVPVPFVNKASSRTVEQDFMETLRNKDWDPNAALQVKPVTKPVDSSVTPAPAAEIAAPVVKPADAKPAEVKPAVSADPLGDLAKARSGAAKADPYYYFVQLGAFRTAVDAESQRARLSLGGIEAKVSEREQSGRTVYRVRVGPYEKKDDAIQSKEKLDAVGLETALVSVAR
ncbi:SPOR domain-containing protein [Rhodoferax sp. PAMC 29310]|uniref:SPOR domain-containing protein n=1 Tax=Rhodoferax sp. PAMC 29310 TaxID=2822760 RepID=UPI001B318D1C|nr:SPOR domain-containing protein [Rhodoferax sp. PAMC 29310]